MADRPTLEEMASYRGRDGLLAIDDACYVKVKIKDARFVFGRALDLLCEPWFGVGQTWVTLRLHNTDMADRFESRLKLNEE